MILKNKKTHIIFAVFTLIFSMFLCFESTNAYTVEVPNQPTRDYKFFITYTTESSVNKNIVTYYFNHDITYKIGTSFYFYMHKPNTSGSYYDSFVVHNKNIDKRTGVISDYYESNDFSSDSIPIVSNISYDFFDFKTNYKGLYDELSKYGDTYFIPELQTPPAEVGGVNLDPVKDNLITQILIIVGSMICLVGLVLGLRVLVRGLRRVSAQS